MRLHRNAAVTSPESRRRAHPVASTTVPALAMAYAHRRARQIGGRVVVRGDGSVMVLNR